MELLGLDFDNTIVSYDKLFYKIALEKNLISGSILPTKTAIRDSLRSRNMEDEFTYLQGEVYGRRILEAEPSEGILETLTLLKESGLSMTIISHKTKKPYRGPEYNMHKAAMEWLDDNNFFNKKGLEFKLEQIHFEETKKEKISRIISQGCTIYVDDLPEILKMIPTSINRILYDPKEIHKEVTVNTINNWSQLLKYTINK